MKTSVAWNFIKKYKIHIILCLGFCAFISLVTLLCINWTNLKIIYAAGSSAIAPLMERLNLVYKQENQNSNIDLNVSPTGSGNGIEAIVNNKKQLGNVSRTPFVEEAGAPAFANNSKQSGKFSNQWEKEKIKTITLGWDSIAIIYKLNDDSILDINNDNIGNLFQAFSGNKQISFHDLDKNINSSANLKPYARTGGAVKSGTTEAFIKSTNLNFTKDDATSNAIQTISSGSYSKEIITTKESNIETWMQIKNAKVGAITYLSGGFVLSNLNEIRDSGFKIATYNGISLSIDTVTNGYDWYRPLNTLASIKVDDYVKNWVEWVITESLKPNSKVYSTYNELGIIPISNEQYNSMTIDSNFWVSDYQLIMSRKQVTYGALSS